jgi:hypothetical protein
MDIDGNQFIYIHETLPGPSSAPTLEHIDREAYSGPWPTLQRRELLRPLVAGTPAEC